MIDLMQHLKSWNRVGYKTVASNTMNSCIFTLPSWMALQVSVGVILEEQVLTVWPITSVAAAVGNGTGWKVKVWHWLILSSRPQSISEDYDLLLTVEHLEVVVDTLTDDKVVANISMPQLITIETVGQLEPKLKHLSLQQRENKHMYMHMLLKRDTILPMCTVLLYYCIAKKFGRELNLAVWRSACTTTKLKSANRKKIFLENRHECMHPTYMYAIHVLFKD